MLRRDLIFVLVSFPLRHVDHGRLLHACEP
jgi:hypothetical protein